jgi:hypothetical protein
MGMAANLVEYRYQQFLYAVPILNGLFRIKLNRTKRVLTGVNAPTVPFD